MEDMDMYVTYVSISSRSPRIWEIIRDAGYEQYYYGAVVRLATEFGSECNWRMGTWHLVMALLPEPELELLPCLEYCREVAAMVRDFNAATRTLFKVPLYSAKRGLPTMGPYEASQLLAIFHAEGVFDV